MDSRIIWRRLDQPGHEAARLSLVDGSWHLAGSAVFTQEGLACCIQYAISCDADWRFKRTKVKGWVGENDFDLLIEVQDGQWSCNGRAIQHLDGCIDFDLNFSPSTNTLPIRRLQLQIGEKALVAAAWLRFPSLDLERLEQKYTGIGELTYDYETADGEFQRELSVDDAGFVLKYPGLWEAESAFSSKP